MSYRYVILPTKLPRFSPLQPLQNQIYNLWSNVHGQVTHGSIAGDNFLRNDICVAILSDEQVVA
ncbi:MAG: hypothetical protein KDD22_06400, partial [Bdellovibrionales bacterium]|nr:hypothetical protein [Bdellovibrionales bacterium]